MPKTAQEIIEELRTARMKSRAELEKSAIDARAKLMQAVAKARADAARTRGDAARREAPGAAAQGPEIPFTGVNPSRPESSLSPRAFDGLGAAVQGETPRQAARGGSAAQELLARAGRSPVAAGASQEQPPGAPTAPPLLTSQQTRTTERTRNLGPAGVRLPTRTTTTETTVEPNVLSANEAARLAIARRRLAVEEGEVFADTFGQFQQEFGDPKLAAGVARAVLADDPRRVAELLEGRKGFADKFNRARLEAERTRAEVNRQQAELAASRARVSELEAEELERSFQATPLSVLVGARSLGQATGRASGGGERSGFVGGSLRELRLATAQLFDEGSFKPEQSALAQSISMAAFDSGTVFVVQPGGFLEDARTAFVPLRQVMGDLEAAAAGSEAAEERLVELGLFEREGEDLRPVGELDPGNPNAVTSTMVTDLFLLRQRVEDAAGEPLVSVPPAPRGADPVAPERRPKGSERPSRGGRERASPAPKAAAGGKKPAGGRSSTPGAAVGSGINEVLSALPQAVQDALLRASEGTLAGERAVLQNVGDLIFTSLGLDPQRVPEMPGQAANRMERAVRERRREGGPPLTTEELRAIVAGRRRRSRGAEELLRRRDRLRSGASAGR